MSKVYMGLINKVDMVCLSPVGYGVMLMFRPLALRRSRLSHIQHTRPRRKTVLFKTSLRMSKVDEGAISPPPLNVRGHFLFKASRAI